MGLWFEQDISILGGISFVSAQQTSLTCQFQGIFFGYRKRANFSSLFDIRENMWRLKRARSKSEFAEEAVLDEDGSASARQGLAHLRSKSVSDVNQIDVIIKGQPSSSIFGFLRAVHRVTNDFGAAGNLKK